VPLTRTDPVVEHRLADGTVVRLPAATGGTRAALDAALGAGAGERWTDLLARARRVWEATRRPLVEEPLTSAGERAALAALDPVPAGRPGGLLRRRPPATLAALARREAGGDGRLGALLSGAVQEWGVDPRRAPAGAVVLAYLEHTFGTWYPAGGMRALADAVFERCRERGVEFRFGTAVDRVLQAGGRAAGVGLADGGTLPADAVVWGAPGPGGPPPAGNSRFTVLLALRGTRPPGTVHRTLVHPADPWAPDAVTVRVLRPDDPALRPDDGHETAVVSALVPADGPAGPDAVDWSAPGVADAFADRLLAACDAAGLGLRERLLGRVVRTPADVARETGVPGGVIAAPALAGGGGAFLAAPNTGRLPGAYRVGGFAHPGGGIAHAGMSGALAAGLIVEGPDWRGSA
jgi:phytoene dehydrogenase-like protein